MCFYEQLTNWQYWPFVVLAFSVALVVICIAKIKLHPFFSLIAGAIVVGLLSRKGMLPGEPKSSHLVQALEQSATELGTIAGKIGLVIALASIISLCLMESGAADKIVRRFLAVFGEKRAALALMLSSYIISISIFFDTFFMLLLPIAQALRLRTGKDYLLYVLSIACAGSVTHSLVIPHPGPIAMAEILKIDMGFSIIFGVIVGLVPAFCSWGVAVYINKKMNVPLRPAAYTNLDELSNSLNIPEDRLPGFVISTLPIILPLVLISGASFINAIQAKPFEMKDIARFETVIEKLRSPDNEIVKKVFESLPKDLQESVVSQPDMVARNYRVRNAILDSINGVLRNNTFKLKELAGISFRSETVQLMNKKPQGSNLIRFKRMAIEDAFGGAIGQTKGVNPALSDVVEFLGNRNMALIIGALFSMWLMVKQKGYSIQKICTLIGPAFETAGVIILITSAGGAFGMMLKNSGVGDAIQCLIQGHSMNLILLAWLVACIIRIAQGSATVAMLASAGIVYPLIVTSELPYHPIYIFLAIGFGAMGTSWMNDSGFWVISRLSGFTEKETIKSWSVIISTNAIVGLLETLILSWVLPLKGF
jgi:H+/gluconate symporter-like permease